MIIVSQPRNSITNFDNITNIELEEYKNESWIIKCFLINDRYINLAQYKTEERAKEVLREILNKYKNSYSVVNDNLSYMTIVPIPTVYEMPEE